MHGKSKALGNHGLGRLGRAPTAPYQPLLEIPQALGSPRRLFHRFSCVAGRMEPPGDALGASSLPPQAGLGAVRPLRPGRPPRLSGAPSASGRWSRCHPPAGQEGREVGRRHPDVGQLARLDGHVDRRRRNAEPGCHLADDEEQLPAPLAGVGCLRVLAAKIRPEPRPLRPRRPWTLTGTVTHLLPDLPGAGRNQAKSRPWTGCGAD